MIQGLLPIIVALIGVLCMACYPVQEPSRGKPRTMAQANPSSVPSAPDRQSMLQKPGVPAEVAGQTNSTGTEQNAPIQKPAAATPAIKDSPEPTHNETLTAKKAPGRPGYVLSPYSGKLMLISGIPSGTVVPDQTCPPSEKRFFRVP